MSKVITAQMMSELSYTCEDQAPLQKVENTNDNTYVVKRYAIVFKNYDASSILNKIKENLDELATIESKENYVPLVRAKKAFTTAIDLLPISLIQDSTMQCSLPRMFWADRRYTILNIIVRIMICVLHKYSIISVLVDSRREKLINYLAKILDWDLSYKYDLKIDESLIIDLRTAFSMFVFRSSDLEAATDYLNQAIGDPSGMDRVRQIYVQESIIDRFKAILKRKLRGYSSEVINDPWLRRSHDEIKKIVKKLNASTIRPLNALEGEVTPAVCYEFDKSYFPPDSPVVILKVFRTPKEAVSLATKDKVFNVSIWTENFVLAYELVNSLNSGFFWINCLGVFCKRWMELIWSTKFNAKQAVQKLDDCSGVRIENSYHFEHFKVNGMFKFVAFPFGVSFAN